MHFTVPAPGSYLIGSGQQGITLTGGAVVAPKQIPCVAKLHLKYIDEREETIEYNFSVFHYGDTPNLHGHVQEQLYRDRIYDSKTNTLYNLAYCTSIQILSVSSEFDKDLQEVINEE